MIASSRIGYTKKSSHRDEGIDKGRNSICSKRESRQQTQIDGQALPKVGIFLFVYERDKKRHGGRESRPTRGNENKGTRKEL